jgi:hypothetical protein
MTPGHGARSVFPHLRAPYEDKEAMLKLRQATRFRKSMAAIGLVFAPLAFGAGDVVRLIVEGDAQDAVAQLAAINERSGLWLAAGTLDLVGVVLFVPAVLAFMHLLRERSTALSHIGGALAPVGLLGWAAHWRGYFGALGALAASTLEPSQAVAALSQWDESPDTILYVLMFVLAWPLGMLFLGSGLLRARVTPRWAAGVFVAGLTLWYAVTFTPEAENPIVIGLVHAVMAIGLAATGLSVLRMPDSAWARAFLAGEVAPAQESPARSKGGA